MKLYKIYKNGIINKQEIQQRILQHGKPLDLDKFTWDDKTKTFASEERFLVINFNYINDVNILAGVGATITAGSRVNIITDKCSRIKAGDNAIVNIDCGKDIVNITVGNNAVITVGNRSYIQAGNNAIINAEDAFINVGNNARITAGDGSIISVKGYNCVIIHKYTFRVILPKKGEIIKF